MSHTKIYYCLIVSALVGAVLLLGGTINSPVKAQQEASINVTTSDVERLRDNFNDARNAIYDNNTTEAQGSLNFANVTLLEVIGRQGTEWRSNRPAE